MKDNPILITGVYRSGTTILSRMLDAHSELDIAYDSVNYFRWYIKKTVSADAYHQIVDEIGVRLADRYGKVIDRKRLIKTIEALSHPITHAQIYSSVMNEYFSYSGKRWGEKTLMEWSNIPVFLDMYPEGKAIHIIRDPRDVMSSYKRITIETGNKYLDSVFACMHSMDSGLQYRKVLPGNGYYLVLYESLIQNPTEELGKLCDFLELDYTTEMLEENNYKDHWGNKLTKASNSSYSNKGNKIPMGRWKDHLLDYEVMFVEGMLSGQMNAFGYESSCNNANKILKQLIEIIRNEPLLMSRFQNYINTGNGVESYPSDPTNPNNWGE